MMGKTHMVGGALGGMSIITITGTQNIGEIGVIMGTSLIGSLAPDLDHPKSKLSNANIITKLISMVISSFTSHRRATHTVWFSFIIGACGYLLGMAIFPLLNSLLGLLPIKIDNIDSLNMALLCGVGMLAGALSHIIFDTFNKEGIMWLHPISKKRFSILPITTSSTGEAIFAGITSVILLVWVAMSIGFGSLEVLKIFKIW